MDVLRRIVVGIVWFFIFSLGTMAVAGWVIGFISSFDVTTFTFIDNTQAGTVAGQAFAKKYAMPVFWISVILSFVGTITEFLPGTKSKKKPNAQTTEKPTQRTAKP